MDCYEYVVVLLLNYLLHPFNGANYCRWRRVNKRLAILTRNSCRVAILKLPLTSPYDVEHLPPFLHELEISANTRLDLTLLPSSLSKLTFSHHFNKRFLSRQLPTNLCELVIGSRYNKEIDLSRIPPSLTTLKIFSRQSLALDKLVHVRHLTLGKMKEATFPPFLTSLHLRERYCDEALLPASLTRLVYDRYTYENKIVLGHLPRGLKVFRWGKMSISRRCYSLESCKLTDLPPDIEEFVYLRGTDRTPFVQLPATLRIFAFCEVSDTCLFPSQLETLFCLVENSSPELEDYIATSSCLRNLSLTVAGILSVIPPVVTNNKLTSLHLHVDSLVHNITHVPPKLEDLRLIGMRGISLQFPAQLTTFICNGEHISLDLLLLPITLQRLEITNAEIINLQLIGQHLPNLERLLLHIEQTIPCKMLPRGLREIILSKSSATDWRFFPRHLVKACLPKNELAPIVWEHFSPGIKKIRLTGHKNYLKKRDRQHMLLLKEVQYREVYDEETSIDITDEEEYYRVPLKNKIRNKSAQTEQDDLFVRQLNLDKFLQELRKLLREPEIPDLMQREYAAYHKYGLDLALPAILAREYANFVVNLHELTSLPTFDQ